MPRSTPPPQPARTEEAMSDKQLDQVVLRNLAVVEMLPLLNSNASFEYGAPRLLAAIVQASPTLDQTYVCPNHGANLLKDASLMDQLEKAWAARSFAKIRSWGVFYPPNDVPTYRDLKERLTQRGTFYPPNDVSTYRDLLLFEERLKTNAASLKRRKSRYQLFLAQLLLVIFILLSDVLLDTAFLALPLNFLLGRVWPDRSLVVAHSYVTSGVLFIAVTTLVLFFASGLYAEKIGYANRYVPHANRALRSFNVYLNVRSPPLRFSLNPFSYFSRIPTSTTSASPPSHTAPPSPYQHQQAPAPTPRGSSPRRAPAIPPIPPTSNPRGELIFSSRVDPAFREAYERYRAAFERKREEQRRAARGGWFSFLSLPWPWPWQSPRRNQQQPQVQLLTPHAGLRDGTPSSSRRSSPAPGAGVASRGSLRRGKASRSGTPALEAAVVREKDKEEGLTVVRKKEAHRKDLEKESHRMESFSFLLAGRDQDSEASNDP